MKTSILSWVRRAAASVESTAGAALGLHANEPRRVDDLAPGEPPNQANARYLGKGLRSCFVGKSDQMSTPSTR